MGPVEFTLVAMTSIIAVMNPTNSVAIYIALTKDVNSKERHKVVVKSMKISFVVFGLLCFYTTASLFSF